jgi:hypothetical protein
LDNTVDVATLLEDSDTKTAALEKVAELEEDLGFVSFLQTPLETNLYFVMYFRPMNACKK